MRDGIQELAKRSPTLVEAYDATRPDFWRYVKEVSAWYRGQQRACAELDAEMRASLDPASSIGLRLALKVAESQRIIERLEEPLTITLLNPVYKETEEDSVSTIGGSRNVRGRLFIEIWQHFLPQLAERVRDTNRAFKAFDAVALDRILDDIRTYTFPYQIELLQACVSHGIPLRPCGIAYLDSEAASTQQGDNITETYLHQIRQIIDIARRYETLGAKDELARFFERISEEEWAEIERHPPRRLADLV